MKKKTVYIWMGTIVALTIALFAAISVFNLDRTVKPMMAAANPTGEVDFRHTIYGSFETPLTKPMDVAKIGEFVYVSDTDNKQVQAFDLSGTPIFQFGSAGDKEGEFQFPYGIAGDEDGNVYVADLYNSNISVFDQKGNFLRYFTEKDSQNQVITSPGGLRIYDDILYVTDIQKHKVFVFDLEGNKLLEIGEPGSGDGQFVAPNNVALDKDKNIYVSDSGNNRVQIFDKDGKFVKIINGSSDGKGQSIFINPRGIGVDGKGNLFVVSNITHNVYVFDKDGNQETVFGGMGTEDNQFYLPNGLFIDDRGTVYVTDTVNQRVTVLY